MNPTATSPLIDRLGDMDFAQRLAAVRKERGLTQQTLADQVGIHVTQIRRYEAGTSQPTLDRRPPRLGDRPVSKHGRPRVQRG